MDSSVIDMLNTLRTETFAQGGGRKSMLGTIDSLELALKSMQNQLEIDHQMIVQRDQQLAEAAIENRLQKDKLTLLEHELRLQISKRFGRSAENWTPDEKIQAGLFDEIEKAIAEANPVQDDDNEPDTATSVEFPPHRRKKRKQQSNRPEDPVKGRKPLPAHLERREKRLELPEAELVCTCCGKDLVLIGEETSERLCVAPVKYYVERTIRPKYGCKDGCGGIHVAPVPLQVMPKSNASPSFLAQVIASKFCDSLPFYRQSNIMKRDGIDISRATMARWAWESHLQLLPLFTLINTMINTAPVKQMDETKIRVLHDNETGEALPGNSWMWCSAARIPLGNENGVEQFMKLISFHYDPGRGMEVAEELLAGFKGVLMSDAYASYNTPSRLGGIEQAACMAHVRRKYHDIVKIESGNTKAQIPLGFIAALYDVEREYGDGPPQELYEARQRFSRPVMDKFWLWLIEEARTVLPKSTLGKAINYTIPLWQRLQVFLNNPLVPIDNNLVERAIRIFAVGRNNFKFFDESTGAEASTVFYTLISTAIANNVEPMHYLQFLFNCLEHFGFEGMPWEKLLPMPSIRDYAKSAGIDYSMGY